MPSTNCSRRSLALLIGASLLLSSTGHCTNADAFKTSEYYASTGLELVNAAEAYALGYTGRGILLGINDEFALLSHPELANKSHSFYIAGPPLDYDWVQYTHGSHVGGIMAAAKNNIGMHGLAFDADLLSGNAFANEPLATVYQYYNTNPQIRVINNSWGFNYDIDVIGEGKEEIIYLLNRESDTLPTLRNSITNYDKVLVFAAGNHGHTAAGGSSLLSYLQPETAGNFVNVVALNKNAFHLAENRTDTQALASFSDLTKYVEENSIAAPGWDINSLNSATGGYLLMSGTSMAAPYVTATVGLVQQAFPYMTGKQLTDTVLSSANKSFALPSFTLVVQEDTEDPKSNSAITYPTKIDVFYFGPRPAAGQVLADLTAYYQQNQASLASFYGYTSLDQFLALPQLVYENTPREMVFGQGLLDAGSAVRGPGLLNARRLDASSFSPAAAYGKNQALYAINTHGYNSVWSNDIGEKRAGLLAADSPYEDLRNIYAYYKQGDVFYAFSQGQDYINFYNQKAAASGLLDLPVGLYKEGGGILALTGSNTYQGSSIAAGGTLQIDGSVAGDAYILPAGTLAGSGRIAQSVYNRGILQPGSYSQPGTLSIDGNLASSGQLAIAVQNGIASKIAVTGAADINGTSFCAVPGSIYRPTASNSPYTVLTASAVSGAFTSSAFTGLLNASGSQDGSSAYLQLTRNNNLDAVSPQQQQTYAAVNTMYDRLEGQATQRQLDSLYSLNAAAAKTALSSIYGGAQVNQSLLVQRSPLTANAVTARLDQTRQLQKFEVAVPVNGLSETEATAKSVVSLPWDERNSWWFKLSRSGGSLDAKNDIPGIQTQGFGFTLGWDRAQSLASRSGWFLSYEKTDASSDQANSNSRDYRLGWYRGYTSDTWSIDTQLAYGQQRSESTRTLQNLGLNANSLYHSRTFSASLAANYKTYQEGPSSWRTIPYGALDITHYRQDSYAETDAGVYNQQADDLTNTYSTFEAGLKFTRPLPHGRLSAKLGYKHVLSGYNPEMTVTFSGNPQDKLTVTGSTQDRNYLTWQLASEGSLGNNWSLTSQVSGEKGQHSHYWQATAMLKRVW